METPIQPEIAAAFVKAQKAFGPALKSATNPHFRSRYADLSACVEAVIDALNANDIALLQRTYECADGVMVETVFIHASGQVIEGGLLHVPAPKHDPQGYGSALTYARRYSLLAATGLAPEDDDGNAASKKVVVKPTGNAFDALPDDRKNILTDVAMAIMDCFNKDDIVGAYGEWIGVTDQEEKIALWEKLPSNVRSAIKKHSDSLKGK
jgi:ERF superfamily